jgi:hypothetical protein
MIAGIDIGYGFTKVFERSQRFVAPSAVSATILDLCFGKNPDMVEVNGKSYSVGERVLNYNLPVEITVGDDFLLSDPYFALLANALIKINMKMPDICIVGLPPAYYTKKTVQELKAKARSIIIRDMDGRVIRLPERISVLPQGYGIYLSHIEDHPEDFRKNILTLDIGYNTLDALFLRQGGDFDEKRAVSYPLGVLFLYEEAGRLFSRVYCSFPKGRESIEKLLRNGRFTHLGKEYTLDMKEVFAEYTKKVLGALKGFVRDIDEEVDAVVVGGGGAAFLDTSEEVICILDNPQMGNAKGYYIYGEKVLSS